MDRMARGAGMSAADLSSFIDQPYDDGGLMAHVPSEWDDAEPQADPGESWKPLDLTHVLDGTVGPIMPEIGSRDDGVKMFYPGRTHSIISESEAGKTWLSLAVCVTEMNLGHNVVYVDFEDDEHGITQRLGVIGAPAELILKRFRYIRPEAPMTDTGQLHLLDAATGCRIAFIDGVTEAMVMHGLNPIDLMDIPKFDRWLLAPLTRRGLAVCSLDHVVKDATARGRTAIGSVHKLNAVTGAQYILEPKQPFGVGLTGRSAIRVAKDRPGQIRRHCLPGKEGLAWFGDLVVKSTDPEFSEVSIYRPRESDGEESFRPTALMVKLSAYIATNPGFSQTAIFEAVPGKTDTKRLAIEKLVAEGYVRIEQKSQTRLYYSNTPFKAEAGT
jgi:hypothetical protein